MRLHRFFVKNELPEAGETAVIEESGIVHQWRHVFRFNVGSLAILFDRSGFEFLAQIIEWGLGRAVVLILEKRPNRNIPKREVHLFISIVKSGRFDLAVEKGTELGVSCFHPVLAERSEKKSLNLERLAKIAREASEQSGRHFVPSIQNILPLTEAVNRCSLPIVVLQPSGVRLTQILPADKTPIGFFLGPEGGWSDREINFFKNRDLPLASLGPMTLRTETAAIAVAALTLL